MAALALLPPLALQENIIKHIGSPGRTLNLWNRMSVNATCFKKKKSWTKPLWVTHCLYKHFTKLEAAKHLSWEQVWSRIMERKLESDFLSRCSLKFSKSQLSLSLAMWSKCISLWGECNEETNKIFGPGFPQSCQSLSQQSLFKGIWPTCGVLSKVLKESANQCISKVNGATCPVWSFPPSFSWPFI